MGYDEVPDLMSNWSHHNLEIQQAQSVHCVYDLPSPVQLILGDPEAVAPAHICYGCFERRLRPVDVPR